MVSPAEVVLDHHAQARESERRKVATSIALTAIGMVTTYGTEAEAIARRRLARTRDLRYAHVANVIKAAMEATES